MRLSRVMLFFTIFSMFASACSSTRYVENGNRDIDITFHNKGPNTMYDSVFVTHTFSYGLGDIEPGGIVKLRVRPSYTTEFRQVRTDYMTSDKKEISIIFGIYLGAQNYGGLQIEYEDGKVFRVTDNTKRSE